MDNIYTTAVAGWILTWLTAVSQVPTLQSLRLGFPLLAGLRYRSPLLHSSSDTQIRNWLTSGESILLPPTCWLLPLDSLFFHYLLWTSFSFSDSLDGLQFL